MIRMLGVLKGLFRIRRFIIGASIFLFMLFLGLLCPLLYPVDPFSFANPPNIPPSPKYLLGTDGFGRDLFAQLLHGIRTSLYVGFIASLTAILIGTTIGAIAGSKGGVTDESLMLITNIILLMPSVLLMVLISAYLKERSPLMVALVIGATIWPGAARAIRAQTLSLVRREYIQMSLMSGYTMTRVVFEDIIPNMAGYIFTQFVIHVSGAMLAEAGLSLIGAGPTLGVSLGLILYWAQTMHAISRGLWWWFVPPGVSLVLLASSLFIIASSLDEYFNPRMRGV